MKQLFILLIAASAAFTACNNEADKKPADVAMLMHDSTKFTAVKWSDTTINFGSRKMGDVVNLTFTCTNTGDKPLYISDVHPSCGCTLVDYSKQPIAPGKQGKIDAQFDTKKSHSQEVHKTIFVRTNTDGGARYLSFSGTVISDSSKTAKK